MILRRILCLGDGSAGKEKKVGFGNIYNAGQTGLFSWEPDLFGRPRQSLGIVWGLLRGTVPGLFPPGGNSENVIPPAVI